jgi:hypothetical protein
VAKPKGTLKRGGGNAKRKEEEEEEEELYSAVGAAVLAKSPSCYIDSRPDTFE